MRIGKAGIDRTGQAPSAPRRRLLAGLLGAPALALPAIAQASAAAGGLPAVISSARRAIVAIGVHAPLASPRFRFLGSGFAMLDGSKVVTCAHVLPVLDPAKRETLAIAVPAGEKVRVHTASATRIDRDTDLALLSFEGERLPPLQLAAQEHILQGTEVVLLGFPIGSALGLFAAAHRGIVAAITPMIIPAARSGALLPQQLQVMRGAPIQLLQLDATAYPGNSGGPLVDTASGRVVGVMSFGLAKGSRESAIQYPTGISYAIPSRYVSALLGDR